MGFVNRFFFFFFFVCSAQLTCLSLYRKPESDVLTYRYRGTVASNAGSHSV